MRGCRLLSRCKWDLRPSGILRSVDCQLVTYVSGQHIVSVFRGYYLPICSAKNSRRPKVSLFYCTCTQIRTRNVPIFVRPVTELLCNKTSVSRLQRLSLQLSKINTTKKEFLNRQKWQHWLQQRTNEWREAMNGWPAAMLFALGNILFVACFGRKWIKSQFVCLNVELSQRTIGNLGPIYL